MYVLGVLVADGEVVLLLHRELDLNEGEGVQAHVVEGGVRIVLDVLLGETDPVNEDPPEIVKPELSLLGQLLLLFG